MLVKSFIRNETIFCVEHSHFGLQRIQKVDIDIPIIREMPGLGGKWNFIYMTCKQ